MLTEEEIGFIKYWEKQRTRKKSTIWQLAIGLPLGVTIVIAIFINFISGWYKRTENILQSNSSLVLVLLVAGLLIVAFIVIFSIHHKWDMNEQRYKELLSRKDIPENL